MSTNNKCRVLVQAPTYWASALINGDYSGLSDDIIREINAWIHHSKLGFPEYAVHEGPGYWDGKLADLSSYAFFS